MNLKRLLVGTTAAMALCTGATVQAADLYVSIFGGTTSLDSNFSVGSSGGSSKQVLDWNFGKYNATGPTKTKDFGTSSTSYPTWVSFPNGQPTGIHSFTAKYAGKYASITTNQSIIGSWGGGFDTGFVVGAAIGMDLGQGFRGELEIAYRSNDIHENANFQGTAAYGLNADLGFQVAFGTKVFLLDIDKRASGKYSAGKYSQFTTAPVNQRVQTNGSAETWSFMANVWYDFINDGPITPFIGFGIGLANMFFDHSFNMRAMLSTYQWPAINKYLPLGTAVTKKGTTTGTNITGYQNFVFGGPQQRSFNLSYRVSGEETVLAYQFGAGLAFDMGGGISLTAQYRYFGTEEYDFGPQVGFEGESHDVMVGLNIPLNLPN